jgi:hypothetical protein
MTQPTPDTVLAFFKALAHESRLKILGLLATQERNVQDLARALDLREPTVSHHLALLRDLGLVRLRLAGNVHWYGLEADALADIARTVLSRERIQSLAEGFDASADARRILEGYLTPDGRLKDFPAQRKKRRVVLAWLAGQFEPGRRYAEAEVNDLLLTRFHDCAILRRELIGYRMMARENGIYWRLPQEAWTE